ncbi:MAG: hypothetical protein A2Y76_14855 [Planctomycetes bacterium RBG_13_60_9]|nr:MAG: hypothetical protein A2Y76_14855 [Planctomycetes bacterium RBG_13_60_9]
MKATKNSLILAYVLTAMCIASQAKADFIFGTPENLGPVINSASGDGAGATTSADGLELYFCSDRPGGSGGWDIWISTRQSVDDPWGPPANLGPTVNSQYGDCYPSLSSDGLTLYFSGEYSGSPRPGGLGGTDIWMTARVSRNAPWGPPVNLGASVNSSERDFSPTISGDGLTLVFTSTRSGGMGSWDLWTATRASVTDAWNLAVDLGANVNSGSVEGECALSADGLALFFLSNRAGGMGSWDLWMATPKSANDSWGSPVNLGPAVNSAAAEGSAGISADMRTLYFTSDRGGGLGGYDLWQSAILPIVDFNADGVLDLADLVLLIENWGTNNALYDIGPFAWGDGIVDAADLEVLMNYWGQEIPSPFLVAHWKLDETGGTLVADSAGANDGTLVGEPLRQPEGGKVGGALLLDGVDDCVTTEFVCDPSAGPFSVFAWVKGGAPGQGDPVPGQRGQLAPGGHSHGCIDNGTQGYTR